MAAPPSPPVRRRPLRVRPLLWLVVGGLLVLIGRGLGLFGHDAKPQGATESAALPPASPPPAPAVEPAPPEGPRPAVQSASAAGIDADRFASVRALIAHRTAAGMFGEAQASLQGLRAQPLDAAQLAAVAELEASLAQALGDAGRTWAQALGEGRVLGVHAHLVALRGAGNTTEEDSVVAALAGAGVAMAWRKEPAATDETLPIARALPRGAAVRFLHQGRLGNGFVVDASTDRVTVRQQDAAGQSFPTVPRTAVEKVGGSRDDAVEAGLAALHAGDVLLARLWLAAARLARDEPASGREAMLARRLD